MLELDIELRRGTFQRHVRLKDDARVIALDPVKSRCDLAKSLGVSCCMRITLSDCACCGIGSPNWKQ